MIKLDYLHKILIFICVVCIITTIAIIASQQYIKKFKFVSVSNVSNDDQNVEQHDHYDLNEVKNEDVLQQTQV